MSINKIPSPKELKDKQVLTVDKSRVLGINIKLANPGASAELQIAHELLLDNGRLHKRDVLIVKVDDLSSEEQELLDRLLGLAEAKL